MTTLRERYEDFKQIPNLAPITNDIGTLLGFIDEIVKMVDSGDMPRIKMLMALVRDVVG